VSNRMKKAIRALQRFRRAAKRSEQRRIKRKNILRTRHSLIRKAVKGTRIRSSNRPFRRLRTVFPETLDFLENREETLAFFNEFKLRTIIDPADEVFLDLSQLKKMAPEAALVLIAEATRAAEYGCRLRGHRAPDGLIDYCGT
jgi:hypothetical protein